MFDYVIVGAGSAGCVLAHRLTENPATSVMLLEAGGPDDKREIDVPVAFSALFKTEVDWAYETEPQPHLNNRQLYWPRGKTLGGSGSINAMIYIRGHRRDYDRWAELGNEGWAFADVLPYFKRGQHQERGGSTYHGVGGPLNVADLRSPNPLSRAFVAAAFELGFPRNNDFNGPEQEGFGLYQVTQRKGQRHSAAAAYLKPALKRPNLTVQTHAHVTRICWQGIRATGVEYQQEEQTHEVLAGKEVILCGGAINSPQLLLLSGVGPGEHLQEMGIPVVAELPGVGQNLQDHVAVPLVYDCTQPGTLEDAESIVNLIKFLLFRRGPLTSNVGEAGGFIKTRPELDVPDIQYHFAPAYYLDHGFTKREGNGMTLGPTLIHPESRGHIRLRSADPLAAPAIQPNYLDSQADMVSLLEGLKVARQLAHAQAFAAVRGPEFWPGKEVQTDEEWQAYIRDKSFTLYHPAGTCKMGIDPMAVVDPQLRVHGVEGLRVVDASVMPTVIGGNTNAPTMMIAEKAADLIKGSFQVSD